jgi:tetratricopeptide (TPR) repeat protein
MRSTLVVVVWAALASSACKREVEPPKVTPPTTEEADAFAKHFATVIGSCDESKLEPIVDYDTFGARAVSGYRLSQRELDVVRKELRRALVSTLCDQLAGSDYKHLRTQTVNGTPRPLFRLVDQEAAFNYHVLELGKSGGKVRLVDMYLYTTGEDMTATLRDLIDRLKDHSGMSTKLTINRINQLRQDGKPAEARELLTQLPADVRKTKGVMLMDVMLADVDDPAYLEAIDKYSRAFPNDPSLDVVRLDALFLRKKYGEAHAIIDRIDKRVGGDAYLDTIRAGLHGEAGEHPQALAAAKRATEREPMLESAWWQLLTQQTGAKQYVEATATLDVLVEKFDAEFDEEMLAADERYTAFSQSQEFLAWLKRQPEAQ